MDTINIIQEIKKIIALQDPQKKRDELTQVGDVFEYWHNLKKEDVVQGTEMLLVATLQEKDKYVKERFLRAISMAISYYDKENVVNSIGWEGLAGSLSSLEEVQISYVLDILSLTGEEKYLSTIEKYAQSVDPDIKRQALYAITELKGRIARANNSQKDE